MRKQVKQGISFLVAVFAVLLVMTIATDAHNAIVTANPLFLSFSVVFFSLSITVWILSWALLIKKPGLSLSKKFIVGWSSVYGALTPIQIGAEALRSLHLKDLFKVPFTESVSASMLIKGIKFLVLTILAAILLYALLISANHDILSLVGLGSGFIVMVVAVLLFLLPLNQSFGFAISRLFEQLSRKFSFLKPFEEYFKKYSGFLQATSKKMFLFTFVLAIASLFLELVSLQFAFFSMNVVIPFANVVILFVLVSVLERTPVLPRGIGLVELASFTYLSLQASASFPLTSGEIASVIIIFDIARLVFPTLLSILVYLFFLKDIDSGNQITPQDAIN